VNRGEHRLELGVAAVLLAGCALPFWSGRYLPLLDLPQHLGLAAVIARHGDPATLFARTYSVDPQVTPYWAYYGAMWLLTRVLALETANRLVFTAYAVGIPLAAAFLLASFGRDRRWAVLVIPLVFGTNLFFGFATFLVSVPLFLLALGLSERYLSAPCWRGAAVLAALAVLVFLAHAQTFLLLGLCVLALACVHVRSWRGLVAAGAPFLPSLVLFATWGRRSFLQAHSGVEGHTPQHTAYGTLGNLGAVYEPWRTVLGKMPERLLGSFGDGSDARIGLLMLALFLVALLAEGLRRPRRPSRCDLLFAALLAVYLFTPMEIAGQWYLNARYLVFAALAAPLLLAEPASGWRGALVGAAAVVALVACFNASAKVRAFQRQVGDFDRIAAQLPPGGRVLGLPFDTGAGGPVRLWPFLHWACWEQILAGGDVGFSFAGLPSIPVRYRPGMQAPHPYEWRPDTFDWASMGRHYDAFLVSGAPRGRGGADLARHAVPVARAGSWSLWRPRNGLTDRDPSSR
jgi:hypothetical protein